MRTATIDKGNYGTVEWDDNYFKSCEFEDFSIEGEIISSDFICCSFRNVNWYWGLFTQANFVQCKFENCAFRGTSFPDARFVECTLDNCEFAKDNLGSDCDFARAVAYSCKVNGSEGFKPEIRA
jgi:uncharacterized protein YjbI with pentapeptide repeats